MGWATCTHGGRRPGAESPFCSCPLFAGLEAHASTGKPSRVRASRGAGEDALRGRGTRKTYSAVTCRDGIMRRYTSDSTIRGGRLAHPPRRSGCWTVVDHLDCVGGALVQIIQNADG